MIKGTTVLCPLYFACPRVICAMRSEFPCHVLRHDFFCKQDCEKQTCSTIGLASITAESSLAPPLLKIYHFICFILLYILKGILQWISFADVRFKVLTYLEKLNKSTEVIQ